jgi:hydroxymethylpyrimidine/phosphomethylpyrimidine kinase
MKPKALTIAGSDSGGGAGLQADLKTFTAFGVHGSSVVTAITAQNTLGVASIAPTSPEIVFDQYVAVMADIGAHAGKIGMLARADVIEALARGLDRWPLPKLVVDPVLASTSGERLLDDTGIDALRRLILPRACLLTPNSMEAEVLTGRKIRSDADLESAARDLLATGPKAILITGGESPASTDATDLYYDGTAFKRFSVPRIDAKNTHGTGCVLSAAITASLALGRDLPDSIRIAKDFVTRAIKSGYALGAGLGPVDPAN